MTTDPNRASFAELATALLSSLGPATDTVNATLFALQVAGAMTDDYVPVPVEPYAGGSFAEATEALRAVRGGEKDVGTLAIAKLFGDYRARVTNAEAVGARRVSMLMTALRAFEALPADDALASRLAGDIRVHLRARWGWTVPIPCPSVGIGRGLCQAVALRHDLLPAEWRAR